MREHGDITNTVRAHADTVLRVCSLYFHGRPERDDAFQETFIKYSQSDKEFSDGEHVKAWLITVASNTCKDMLRRSEAKTVLLDKIDDAAQPGWGNGATENDPAAYGTGSERADELNEALQQLDENYRIALYLKYYEGYTAAEIAEMLDKPENTVYTNLARGRKKLKEVLTNGQRR
ncbi:MAG: sigma-70 family RNA polymerase sigma factor [Coriobacteriaceae bacterium]|nr:sigma-70 family RNA polymerase sigma factor [Coriobacteriaceae bacterium]